MVKIIPEIRRPSFSEQLGRGISSAVSGIGTIGTELEKQRALQAKKLQGFSTRADKYLKAYKEEVPGQIDRPTRERIMTKARKLVELGHDEEESLRAAYDDEFGPESEGTKAASQKPSFLKQLGEDIYGAGAKFADYPAGVIQFPFDILHETSKYGRKVIGKLKGLSDEEIAQREEKLHQDVLAGEKATGIPAFMSGGTRLPEALSKATGGRSIPQTAAQRTLQGAVAGIPGLIATGSVEAARGLGLPEPIQAAVGVAAFILGGRGQIPSKVESFARNAVKKAERIAAKTGSTPEQVIQEAQQASGADINAVNEGKGKEIQKLNRGLNEIENKTKAAFKESDKFAFQKAENYALQQHENIRRETARKLAESPLEEHYRPTIKEPITAEGQAAKELRQRPIKESRDRILQEIKQPEFASRSAIERERVLHELRETEFELKYGKKPATQAEIEQQIEKQHAEMREYIKDPTAKKIEKIEKQLKKDQTAIKKAEALAARGELPGPRVVDEFIKIHDQYLKGYNRLANELGEFVRRNKAVKGREPQIQRAQELENLIKRMEEAGRAKVTIQTDKRKALGALEKPSGAFYKNQLKTLFDEIENFKKQLFKVNRLLSPESRKAAKIGKREIGKVYAETEKIGSDVKSAIEKPTEANIEKVSKETGIEKENLGDLIKQTREAGKEVARNPIEAVLHKVINKLKLPQFKTFKRRLRNGIIVGVAGSLIEEMLGIKLPLTAIGLLTLGRIRGAGLAYLVRQQADSLLNNYHADKLRKLRNKPEEFRIEIKKLDKKYSKQRLNKIVKLMKEG